MIDPRTLEPLDMPTILRSVRKTGRLVVVDEACRFAGFGGEIVAEVLEREFNSLRAAPKRIGAPFSPVPFNAALEQAFIPSENDIIAAFREVTRPAGRAEGVRARGSASPSNAAREGGE